MEQPDEKEGRLNISQTITSGMELDKINYLIEQDGRAAQNSVENIDYINVRHNNNDTYYEIKYPEIDEFPDYDKNSNTSVMFNNFVMYLKQSLTDAWSAMDSRNLASIQQIFDLDSIYSQALLDVFVDERDHSWLSIKMFKDSSGKINFGPCWDYDNTSWGYVWADTYNKDPFRNHPTATHHASNEWLAVVTNQISESKAEFKNRFVSFYTSNLNRIKELFFEEEAYISLEMIKDASKWKENNISILYENLRYLKNFLDTRYQEVVSHI